MRTKRKARPDFNEKGSFTTPRCFQRFKQEVAPKLEEFGSADFMVAPAPSGGEMAVLRALFPRHEVEYDQSKFSVVVSPK